MSHSYEELRQKTVAQLRKIAKEIDHEAIHGYSTMHKEHLLVALCTALSLDTHEHHVAVGINKRKIKTEIRDLKQQRTKALAARDHKELKTVLRKIHKLKRRLRAAIV